MLGHFVGTAHAQEAQDTCTDTVIFILELGDTAAIKMTMEAIDYERGSAAIDGEGSIEAPFASDHGWFWRNRDSTPSI